MEEAKPDFIAMLKRIKDGTDTYGDMWDIMEAPQEIQDQCQKEIDAFLDWNY